jgi:Bacteriophage baseplate protein W
MPNGAISLTDIVSADWSLMLDATAGGGAGSGIGNVVQGLEDVNQCLRIIMSTPQGTDPLRPTFAVDLWRYVDYPLPAARAAIVREVTDAIRIWEPRVSLLSVAVAPVIDATSQSGAHLTVTATWQLKLSGARTAPNVGAAPQITTVSLPAVGQNFQGA